MSYRRCSLHFTSYLIPLVAVAINSLVDNVGAAVQRALAFITLALAVLVVGATRILTQADLALCVTVGAVLEAELSR